MFFQGPSLRRHVDADLGPRVHLLRDANDTLHSRHVQEFHVIFAFFSTFTLGGAGRASFVFSASSFCRAASVFARLFFFWFGVGAARAAEGTPAAPAEPVEVTPVAPAQAVEVTPVPAQAVEATPVARAGATTASAKHTGKPSSV